jgi:hypothetical protein
MDDYLAAVDPRQGVRIIIDGQAAFVSRCRLLAHLQLSEIEVKLGKTRNPIEISAYLIEYLSVAGLTDKQIKKASVYELLEAFFALRQINAWHWLLPWLAKNDVEAPPKEAYDYAGRRWAVWVHKLASRYGWTPETIWSLYPEEAAVYMQEIMISEYYDREDRRALSELSYDYDKATKRLRFKPAPMFSWMVDEEPPEPVRIPVRALPVGNVVKIEQ